MKKFAFTTTAVLLGFTQWATAAESDTATQASAASPAACSSSEGSCCKKDPSAASGEQAWLDIETITVEAENGNPIAQYTVAYLMETADDATPESTEKSKEWYAKALPGLEKAAAEGKPAACKALAHMYAEGKGVEKNPELAAKYEKMYKECCKKMSKDGKHHKKECCPDGPGPVQPEAQQN